MHIQRYIITFAICTAAFSSLFAAEKTVPVTPYKISYPALNWKVPMGEPYRKILDNGLVTYIAEDKSLPYVKISGIVRYGTICDPAPKYGISTLMTNLMRTGGTKTYFSDSLDALLDLFAIKLSVSASETQISFSASCLSEYTDTCLFMLSQVLFAPAFEERKVKKQTSILLESIAHRFDNPDPILDAAYDKAMYQDGANSLLATPQSIAAINRLDLVELHKKVFKTENMIVSAAGYFSRTDMELKLQKLFPKAQTRTIDSLFPVINVNPLSKAVIIQRPITQSYIRMGFPLFKRPHDDFYSVQLLNLVLGGEGFTSRLGSKVRSDEGLAYVIYSSSGSNYFFPSTFFVEFQTKNETACKAMAISYTEIAKIRDSGVTAQELNHAKKVLIDGLPSMFRSPDDITANYASNEYMGRKPDHFATFADKVNAITAGEVLRVAKKYLDPAIITYTVVGDTSVIFKNDTIKGFSFKAQKPNVIVTSPDSLFKRK